MFKRLYSIDQKRVGQDKKSCTIISFGAGRSLFSNGNGDVRIFIVDMAWVTFTAFNGQMERFMVGCIEIGT